MTRSRLSELTGVPRSTVNHAVGRLIATGVVVEVQTVSGKASGRPGVGLAAAPGRGVVAGIDFGHGHVAVAVADTLGTVLGEERQTIDVDLDAQAAIAYAVDALERLAADAMEPVSFVVAGVPGPVDDRTGTVRSPTILSGWVGLVPAQELERRLGVTVEVANDAVLGAYGERHLGAGRGVRDFLYVKASGGIGASLMLGGSIYTGASGLAGEIGHTEIAGHTEPCRCGKRGCLEAVVAVEPLRERIAHAHRSNDAAAVDLGDLNDPITTRIMNEAGRILGYPLAGICNLLNPAAVIVGGVLGTTCPAFIEGVEASIRRHALPAMSEEISVLPAALGQRAEILGAVQMAAHRFAR